MGIIKHFKDESGVYDDMHEPTIKHFKETEPVNMEAEDSPHASVSGETASYSVVGHDAFNNVITEMLNVPVGEDDG